MTCPTCKAGMRIIGRGEWRESYHCPNCGTMATYNVLTAEVATTEPPKIAPAASEKGGSR